MTGRRAARRVVAFAVIAALGLVGCGGDDDDATRTRPRVTDPVETTDPGAAAYVGLTKRAAIAKADAGDTPWRITREDDEQFMVTQDYVPERLNFEIDDGTVTSATYG